MKKLLACLFAALISSPALASQDLNVTLAFNTNPFLCTNPATNAVYWNNSGAPMYIRQVVAWMGMDLTGKSDYAVKIKRNSDQAILAFTNWDHYAEPTGLHNLTMNFEPNYMLLADGDALVLEYDCTLISGPATLHGHVVTRIWWTEQP
jgi:hypothetical protein